MHVHSKYSLKCGILEPKNIIKLAIKKGLDGVAITDHDTIKGGMEAKKYETELFKVIVGCEVNTSHGEIIGLFLTEEIKTREINEVIDEIHEQEGYVIVPHPFDKMRKSTLREIDNFAEKIDAIEGFNARCIFDRYNKEAMEFATKQKLFVTAGSDSHYENEIGLGGICTTGNSKEEILNNTIGIFHKKSPMLNHLKTKTYKLLKSL